MVELWVDVVSLAAFLAAGFAAAFVGGRFTSSSVKTWYVGLRKPSWTPPGWFIGLVWSILYPLMAIAAWLVWRDLGLAAALPLAAFFVQLALNVAWSYLFFQRRDPGRGFAGIVALWLAILATLVLFALAVPLAGWLLVPYLAWVTVAGTLNAAIWRRNRGPDAAASTPA